MCYVFHTQALQTLLNERHIKTIADIDSSFVEILQLNIPMQNFRQANQIVYYLLH